MIPSYRKRATTASLTTEETKAEIQEAEEQHSSWDWKDHYGKPVDKDHIVWTLYVQAAKSHDKDVIDALIHGMDILLTFSALFSAIVTAFIIQNESGLNKWDIPSQNTKILVELYKIFQDPKFQNESLIMINEEDSGDLEASIAFWYISFYLSLVVASGA
ncbi:hypothetical protein FRC02_005545, partial [Tulasnella sp. 418]